MPPIVASLIGIVVILAIAFLLSVGKRRIRLRVVAAAFALQALMAFLVLATSGGRAVIQTMSNGVAALLSYADQGTQFLF
ncbi:MAG: NupC/NupG family nucleoside CNT transporter, partial [Alphaproteobacteria bacterium]|nr:NupC/NupG family nucleoside CNT transporter [Alphaproteobacteria bacterium]